MGSVYGIISIQYNLKNIYIYTSLSTEIDHTYL